MNRNELILKINKVNERIEYLREELCDYELELLQLDGELRKLDGDILSVESIYGLDDIEVVSDDFEPYYFGKYVN